MDAQALFDKLFEPLGAVPTVRTFVVDCRLGKRYYNRVIQTISPPGTSFDDAAIVRALIDSYKPGVVFSVIGRRSSRNDGGAAMPVMLSSTPARLVKKSQVSELFKRRKNELWRGLQEEFA